MELLCCAPAPLPMTTALSTDLFTVSLGAGAAFAALPITMVLAPVTDVLVPKAIASSPVVAAPEPIEIERLDLDRTEAP